MEALNRIGTTRVLCGCLCSRLPRPDALCRSIHTRMKTGCLHAHPRPPRHTPAPRRAAVQPANTWKVCSRHVCTCGGRRLAMYPAAGPQSYAQHTSARMRTYILHTHARTHGRIHPRQQRIPVRPSVRTALRCRVGGWSGSRFGSPSRAGPALGGRSIRGLSLSGFFSFPGRSSLSLLFSSL